VKYLLDTNTCIYIINRKPPSAVNHIRSLSPDEIAISTITIAELQYGINRSQHVDRNRIALLEFLVPFSIIDFDQRAAASYGRIRALLEAKGKPIGPMDLLIAAQAVSEKLILITNNEKEFRLVDGLKIENWIRK
jgi:tRNA(fMet)-specific endonuclease VapC